MIPEHPPIRVLALTLANQPAGASETLRGLATVEFHGVVLADVALVQGQHGWRIGTPAPRKRGAAKPYGFANRNVKSEVFRLIASAFSAMTGHSPPIETPAAHAQPAAPSDPWARSHAAPDGAAFPPDGAHHG